ncbi:MAG: YbjN domain-containing protein [Firmicutes bacterium]|nr:YbjN domain-containing protein [Bacillota bacterium]
MGHRARWLHRRRRSGRSRILPQKGYSSCWRKWARLPGEEGCRWSPLNTLVAGRPGVHRRGREGSRLGRHLGAVANFFRSIDLKFQIEEEKSLIHMGFSVKPGSWTAVADVKEDRGIFLFYSIASFKVPEAARLAVAEFLTRANYGIILGNFELDLGDGEVRYKTSINVGENGTLTADLIRPVVMANFFTMDRYLPGIMAVAFGNRPPAEAIRDIEG